MPSGCAHGVHVAVATATSFYPSGGIEDEIHEEYPDVFHAGGVGEDAESPAGPEGGQWQGQESGAPAYLSEKLVAQVHQQAEAARAAARRAQKAAELGVVRTPGIREALEGTEKAARGATYAERVASLQQDVHEKLEDMRGAFMPFVQSVDTSLSLLDKAVVRAPEDRGELLEKARKLLDVAAMVSEGKESGMDATSCWSITQRKDCVLEEPYCFWMHRDGGRAGKCVDARTAQAAVQAADKPVGDMRKGPHRRTIEAMRRLALEHSVLGRPSEAAKLDFQEMQALREKRVDKFTFLAARVRSAQRRLEVATKLGMASEGGPGLYPPAEERWQQRLLDPDAGPEFELTTLAEEGAAARASESSAILARGGGGNACVLQ